MSGLSSLPAAPSSYDPSFFAPLFAVEDRHFWFRARNQIIATVVRQLTATMPLGYRVLEVGCGTGNVLHMLEQVCADGTVVGMDLFADGLQYARRRASCHLIQGNMCAPPFAEQFNLIGMFDVLEHLTDDMQALRDLKAMLVPGGALLLTVPAHQSLWSYFDEESRHCRRYAPSELRSKLIEAGYRVEYLTQYMATIFPLVWLGRRVAALISRSPVGEANGKDVAAADLRVVPVINDVLALLLAQEARVIARRRQLPIGTSIIAVARKA